MKKIIVFITLFISCLVVQAQANKNINATNNIIQNNQNAIIGAYQLFPTQNIWTFIKLNTRNGKLWRVQYGLEDANRYEEDLNLISLVDSSQEINGRFTLYPTDNIYNFILLDKINGKMWQMQWSQDAEHRFIIPILPVEEVVRKLTKKDQ